MGGAMKVERDRSRSTRWRILGWGGAALLLSAPWVAMQFSAEVAWGPLDFVVFGSLLFTVVWAFKLAARKTRNCLYRLATGLALAGMFFLVWLSLGVGIIGQDGDPANLLYFGVIGLGGLGALIARFQPRGMALSLLLTALAQGAVAVIALVARLGYPWSGPWEIIALNGFLVVLFGGSAWLFLRAAQVAPAGRAV